MIYLVTYDLGPRLPFVPPLPPLSGAPSPPHPLYHELESSRSWWHYLDKTWLLSTDETLEQLDKRLRKHLSPTDKLLIVKFHGEYAGSLPPEAWQWIEERIDTGELVG